MSAREAALPARRLHPEDYKRDALGRVSVAEFNRWLPWFRCTDCGMWVNGNQEHTVEICDRYSARRA
jgi:hypothetical protein